MKGRYADGGKLPSAEEAARTAVLEPVEPAPLTEKQRTGKMVVGKSSDLTAEERKKFSRMPSEPVKKAKGGSASSRADGCCQRGKTRGKMV